MLLPRKSKLSQSETGFSVIEVILFLGISSFLLIGIFNTYSDTRKRAQFRDAAQQVTSVIQQTKTEANTTVNTQSRGNNDTPPLSITAGKLAVIPYGSSSKNEMYIYTMESNPNDSLNVLALHQDRVIDLPWGVHFSNGNVTAAGGGGIGGVVGSLTSLVNNLSSLLPPPLGSSCNIGAAGGSDDCAYVAFYRNAVDGHLETFVGDNNTPTQDDIVCIEIESPEGFLAKIEVDAANNLIRQDLSGNAC